MTLKENNKPTYAVIGNGRMATHMVHYLGLLNLPTVHITWSRQIFDNEKTEARFKEIIEGCDIILVLISDSALEGFMEKIPPGDIQFVHFSGQLVSDHAYSAHPLMTFGPELYELADYQKIPFIIESDPKLGAIEFKTLLPGLDNPHFKIARNQKAQF